MPTTFTISKIDSAIRDLEEKVTKREKISGEDIALDCLKITKSLRDGLDEVIKEIDRLKDRSGPGSLGRSGL